MIAQYTLLTTLALHHIVIGGLLILILLVLHKVLKSSAEMRSWVLMTAFITSTLVPITLLSTAPTLTEQPNQKISIGAASLSSNAVNATIETSTESNKEQALWHMPSEVVFQFSEVLTALVVVWLIGSLWRTLMVFGSFLRTRKLIKMSKPVDQQSIRELVIDSNIKIFSASQINSPMVVGLTSPRIILPENMMLQLSSTQLAPIVLHELAHIQRNDIWFSHFQEFIAVVFWWSPVIRLLNNKIHIDRELACDLRAVKQLNNNKQYAQSLIDCAKLMITQQRSVLAMGLFSQKKELNNRVTTVLKSKAIKMPSMLAIIGVCASLSAITIKASQEFVPKISISDTRQNAQHYSLLPASEGEQLISAVIKNNIAAIEQLQQDGVDINTPATGDGTALIIAVKLDNRKMVQALIDLGANVNQSSIGDGNPLITAAMTNNITLAQLLIDNGAEVNAIVRRDETPLINATRRGHFEMTQLLVSKGADVNLAVTTGLSDGNKIRTPLNMSLTNEISDYLIEYGAIN